MTLDELIGRLERMRRMDPSLGDWEVHFFNRYGDVRSIDESWADPLGAFVGDEGAESYWRSINQGDCPLHERDPAMYRIAKKD